MKPIRYGVIGAGGYLGRQLIHYMGQHGLPVEIIPYNRARKEFNIAEPGSQHCDVLLNLGTPNEIFARQEGSVPAKAIEEWSGHLETAIQLSQPSHIVHLSTFHIFGTPESEMNDDSPALGGNAYGDLHLTCLAFVKKMATAYGIALSTVIPTNIYGTISRNLVPRTDLILNLAIDKLRTNDPLQLRSDGSGLRDFLWIEDALRAFCAVLLQAPKTTAETIVVASETTISVREALDGLFSVLGKGTFESWCEFGSLEEKVVPFSFSCKKIKAIMGAWQPQSVLSAATLQKNIFNTNE
jgi:nucleoside-diphosphate-sugar epimerase